MRYTTIIDLRDYPQIYRNKNARLLYLHMVLQSGYHADDRDICTLSIRELAWQVGITVSAARNALQQLSKSKLIERLADKWRVAKFVMPKDIPARPTAAKLQNGWSAEANKIISHEATNEEKDMLYRQKKTEFMWRYEQMYRLRQTGDTTCDKYLNANYKAYCQERLKMEGNMQ